MKHLYLVTDEMLDRITEELPDEAVDGLTPDPRLQDIADAWREWRHAPLPEMRAKEHAFNAVMRDIVSPDTPTLCEYGDLTCPCQDGDACHYKGKNPMDALQEDTNE
jgi:hypothetical protein